jgi:hypothetical protein
MYSHYPPAWRNASYVSRTPDANEPEMHDIADAVEKVLSEAGR